MADKQDTEKPDEAQNALPKRASAKRKALWLAAVLACVAILVAGVQLALSAFTANDFLKAGPVTGTSQDLFASDVLAPYSSDPAKDNDSTTPVLRSIVVDTSGSTCSFSFKIYNCLLDDKNVFNDKEVTYELSVTAKDADGNNIAARETTWSIDYNNQSNPYTFTATRGDINPYTITLDKDLVDKATFTIQATVIKKDEDGKEVSPGTSKYCLAARVAPVRRSDAQSASVSGSWVDAGKNNVNDYAAYNYRITVTGEAKVVKVTWGPKVELDGHFEVNHPNGKDPNVSVDRANRTAYFTVKPGSETINFYRMGSSEPASWDDLGVKIEEANSQGIGN